MKHFKLTIFTLCIVLISISSFAQDSFSAKVKGSYLSSGSISLNSTSSKQTLEDFSSKANTFNLVAGPKVGYYLMDNLAIGLELEVSISSTKEDDEDGKVTSSRIGVGPFARYHFNNGIFGEAGAIIGSTKTTETFGETASELTSNALGFRVGGGYSFFVGNHIALEPAIFYVLQTSKPKNGPEDLKTTLGTVALNIGFTVYF